MDEHDLTNMHARIEHNCPYFKSTGLDNYGFVGHCIKKSNQCVTYSECAKCYIEELSEFRNKNLWLKNNLISR